MLLNALYFAQGQHKDMKIKSFLKQSKLTRSM